MGKLIDLSHTIVTNMPVYPGDNATSLVQTRFLKPDYHNNFELTMSMHSGTHVDSPLHLTERLEHIADLPLDSFVGPGHILDVRGQAIIDMRPEYGALPVGCILLLYSGHDKHYGTDTYYKDYPCLSLAFARFLVEQGIKMVGLDWPSPDKYPFDVHKLLFAHDIYILENLTSLDRLLGVTEFEVIALPLKLRADSSMTRAVARVLCPHAE